MPVSTTATVTPWPVSPWAASWSAPVSWRNTSDGVCGPVDSGLDCTFTESVRGHGDARQRRQHRLQERGDRGLDPVDEVELGQDGAAYLQHRA